MYLLRNGVRRPAPAAWVKPVLALLVAAMVGGCGARSQYPAANVGAPPPQHLAAAQEIEDDGLPVQRPPLVRSVRQPDDPSEPYSRNYGASPAAPVRAAPPTPALPARAAAAKAAPASAPDRALVVATGAD